jgi:glycosyltransferase involved in cell wall biosynthesis
VTFLILICTLPERVNLLRRLTNELDKQKAKYPGLVDYKCHDAGRAMTTGQKRNQLIEQSMSDYFSFCDDDDMVSTDYIEKIMTAIESNPDVVTFNGYMTTNGRDRRGFTIKLGSKYEERDRHYYRFPNHLCAFKRDKVNHIKFPEVWVQEDYIWAKTINDRKLLKTEVHIESDLYYYEFRTDKPSYNERPVKIR